MAHALGIDVGSAGVKAALLAPDGRILGLWHEPVTASPAAALRIVLTGVREMAGEKPLAVGVTGHGADIVTGAVHRESEVVALAMAAPVLFCGARTVIEVGGQSARFVVVDPATGDLVDHGLNQQCAAGSGSFFEEQAARLGLSVEGLSAVAASATRGATVAGRCSVFAKSDMIHLQQKGTPVDEIAYGLCLAMARNFVATVVRGRETPGPVAIAGGAARNPGLVRAFAQVLELDPGSVITPRCPGAEGAVGVARSALAREDLGTTTAGQVKGAIAAVDATGRTTTLGPLEVADDEAGALAPVPGTGTVEAWLGVDVGSVSTNLVLLDEDGRIVEGIYLRTRGRPVEAVGEGLDLIAGRFGDRLRVLGVGVTGSGRHLASHLLGADLVRNEITCQLRGAIEAAPDVDTILEIGGQDSKYIHVRDGHIDDFVMNKICAAGTGSFLEEQAEHLGVAIVDEFARVAAGSAAPAELGCQCTVFMHSQVVAAQRRGTPAADVCAGLAFSVAQNYLDRVVAGRPVGRSVVFSGGVARNPAVVAAFRRILGVPVHVHPHAGVSGAMGAAHLVREARPARTAFRGLEACRDHEVRSFECGSCANRCQVNRIVIDGHKVHFGDACERYSSRVATRPEVPVLDLVARWHEIERPYLAPPAKPRGVIGIPRASALVDMLPFWSTFFGSLGYEVVASEPSSQTTLQKGLRRLPAETCLPIKLAFGHVKELADAGIARIFLPSILNRSGDDPQLSHSCPYVQTVPYMMRAAMNASFITPEVNLSAGVDGFVKGMLPYLADLGVSDVDVEDAYRDAVAVREEIEAKLIEAGREALEGARRALVVIGKPYNVLDPYLNTNLVQHLRRLGELAIPMWCLPFERTALDPSSATLPWQLNRDIVRAVRYCARDERLYPVVVSSFGCGPDAFTQMHTGPLLARMPSLSLEFDEHRAEAGLVTRLEAFIDEIDARPRGRVELSDAGSDGASVQVPETPVRRRSFVIPRFADHAYAFAGALRAAGHDARILPQPSARILKLGEQHTSGKECHPFSVLTGDLVDLAGAPRDREEVFLYPGTVIPCLLYQYGEGHRMLLERMGVTGIEVLTPGLGELREILGLDIGARMWRALVAIDLMIKMVCETRPYEKNRGQTDEVHRTNLRDIETAIASDQMSAGLTMIMSRMREIPVDRSKQRPLVGVAGDVFTRANPVGNQDLFAWLEDQGMEVWPAPFLVDITDFGLRRAFERGSLSEAALAGALMLRKDVESWRVRRMFRGVIKRVDEPGYQEVLDMAAPYLGEEQNEVLLLNVAKIVDFARGGADGILNAACFNCMLGTVSSAITGHIRERNGNIPIANLNYTHVEGGQRPVLEAFVHQVRSFAGRRPRPEVRSLRLGSAILSRLWPGE